MGKKKSENEHEIVVCPVGKFFMDLERVSRKRSTFFHHLYQSRVEFLKAVRSLIDEKIEDLEEKSEKKPKKKARKIAVE
jgi:hypothetical protein